MVYPAMPAPIPIELAEHAIDFLYDDVHALAACALASRVLLSAARFHIWRGLVVPVQARPTHSRMQELVEILDATTDIAPIVQSLTLKGVPSSRPANRTQQQHWDDPAGTLRLWERLPNLRVLKFEFMRFDKGLHQLLPVADALPHLEELALINSRAMLPLECETRPPFRDSVAQVVLHSDAASGPKLKRLTVTGGLMSWPFLEDLAKVLLDPRMRVPLDTLDLSCISRSNNFKLAT